jgi:cytochrome c biogenesis protein CcmG, thiol:disulfide interchange protein DsbE
VSTAAAPTVNRRVLVVGLAVVLPLLGVLLLNLGRDPHLIDSPLVGKPAPAFRLAKLSGGAPVALDDFKGKPVVMNFWATWCVPCMQEHPTLVAAAQEQREAVQFLGVVFDDEAERVRSFVDEHGSDYPALMDPEGKTAVTFGVQGVPETYFIDREGVIVSKYVGPLDAQTLTRELQKATGGKP